MPYIKEELIKWVYSKLQIITLLGDHQTLTDYNKKVENQESNKIKEETNELFQFMEFPQQTLTFFFSQITFGSPTEREKQFNIGNKVKICLNLSME